VGLEKRHSGMNVFDGSTGMPHPGRIGWTSAGWSRYHRALEAVACLIAAVNEPVEAAVEPERN
jgi:hypothetical protein